MQPSDATPWHMPKGSTSNSTDTRSFIFIAALFTLAGRQNQPKCPSSREWILRVEYIVPCMIHVKSQSLQIKWMELE